MAASDQIASLRKALPFWSSIILLPIAWISAFSGGIWTYLLPVVAWYFFTILDGFTGLNLENEDPNTPEGDLYWYRLVTLVWLPLHFITLFGILWYAHDAAHLNTLEKIVLFFGVGLLGGTVGINYSHELMHQKNNLERWAADILQAMVLYSHFRSEHLLVHHRYVGTPRDAVTARYNESFFRFFPRVLREQVVSAFRAERDMLKRKKLPWHHVSNPHWRYWGLQVGMLLLAYLIGGGVGVALFIWQAFVAVWQLELVNYVEHYGLTRKHLGNGKYEHVKPHHSWNAAHKATNWLLINLQRHSDHHYKPDRRYPLLQNYEPNEAPQLPHGYMLMTMMAMAPWIWRRQMNPRVRKWRAMHYPEITDWAPYKTASTPMPK